MFSEMRIIGLHASSKLQTVNAVIIEYLTLFSRSLLRFVWFIRCNHKIFFFTCLQNVNSFNSMLRTCVKYFNYHEYLMGNYPAVNTFTFYSAIIYMEISFYFLCGIWNVIMYKIPRLTTVRSIKYLFLGI